MNKTIERYKDELGYIKDIDSLYKDLLKLNININEIQKIIQNIIENNKIIIKQIDKDNKRIEKIITHKKDNIEEIEYKKHQIKINTITKQNKENYIDISFYTNYIEEHLLEDYTSILPTNKDNDSIKLIDTILAYYLREINTIKYFMITEKDKKEIDIMIEDLSKYESIFNNIKKHKESLYYNENKVQEKNKLVFYMNKDKSFIYDDIVDYPNLYDSIYNLLKSIENGTFKNIKYFSNNDKLKGLCEVRDVANATRIIFDPLGDNTYCIIYAIVDKKESNHLYKQRLYLRYKRYCLEKGNVKTLNNNEDIKKLLLKGD